MTRASYGPALNPLVATARTEGFGPVKAMAGIPGFVNLAAAQHYHQPCEAVQEALHRAVDAELHAYGPTAGEPVLREALAAKLQEVNGVDVDPGTGVWVTAGAGQAFLLTLMAFLEPGDHVLTTDPGFPLDTYTSELLGASVTAVPLRDVASLAARLAAAVRPKTKAVIVHPVNNPTGAVLPSSVIEGIAELAQRHDLLVLSDEVYEAFTYDGRISHSIAALEGMAERTVSLYSFSKDHNLSGLRIGYLATSPAILDAISRIVLNGPVGANRLAQRAALAALATPGHVEDLRDEFAQTRRRVVHRLDALPGVRCAIPDGGLFVFPEMEGRPGIFRRAVEDALVGVADGAWYGREGVGHLRICYAAAPPAEVDEALDRLEELIRSW